MTLAMTAEERENFLADVHIGIISVEDEGRGPLTVPIWYSYKPGGVVSVITSPMSRKSKLILPDRRFSMCAQTESLPYKYVSVEGPVCGVDSPAEEAEYRAMAHRYLGQELGDAYVSAAERRRPKDWVIRMRPERWLTVDYAKEYGDLT